MAQISDIKDKDSLEAWLEDQQREVSVWIAVRAAARVMPLWWDALLTENWARERELTALPVLRSLLISSVAALSPSVDIKRAANAGTAANDANATDADIYAANAAAANAANAGYAANACAANVEAYPFAAYSYAAAADGYSPATWQSIRRDAEQAEGSTFLDALPLWPDGAVPRAEQWRGIKWHVTNSEGAEDWQFWIDWYDAQLEGRTMLSDPTRTWDMLEQIALIKPETWDAGPDTVNPLIREIWKLHRLRSEVAALQAEKDAFLATRESEVQRSHDQPPDGLVDDQPELARQITIVGNSLDEARDALERDAPDKGWLRAIAEKLLSALTAVTKYCAKVADTAVISAAKVGGGAGGAAMVDYFANNGRLMQFAKDLLSYAAGV